MTKKPTNVVKAQAGDKTAKIKLELREWVYFDTEGNELFRLQNMLHNRTFVQIKYLNTEFDGRTVQEIVRSFEGLLLEYEKMLLIPLNDIFFVEAPMPGIIPVKYNYDGDDTKIKDLSKENQKRYNQYDFQIAAYVYIFNREKRRNIVPIYNKSMLTSASGKVPDLNPTRIKAMIFLETDAGETDSKDIMRSNVDGDWDKCKVNFGLTKGVKPTPKLSIKAGIGWLFTKGIKNLDTGLIPNEPTEWTGGADWSEASRKYNGSQTKITIDGITEARNIWYRDFITKMINEATPQP